MAVKASVGDAATPALEDTPSATVEGKSSTTLLGNGAAKTHLAFGKEMRNIMVELMTFTTLAKVMTRMKEGGGLELNALGRRST